MKEVFLGSTGESGGQKCKLESEKILELLNRDEISTILSDSDFQKEFRTLKAFLGYYLRGNYDEDDIGYLAVSNDNQFFSLRCLYDYALVEAELGRFETHDSCVNMDFDSYYDMSVIVSKELDKICLITVAFDASGGEDSNFEALNSCYKTKIGIFKSNNGKIESSIYSLTGKKDFENGNIKLENDEMQTRLNILVKEVNLY